MMGCDGELCPNWTGGGGCGDCPGYDDGLRDPEEADGNVDDVEYVDLRTVTDEDLDAAEAPPPPQFRTLGEIHAAIRLLTEQMRPVALGMEAFRAWLDESARVFAVIGVHGFAQVPLRGYPPPLAIDGHEYHRRRRGRARRRRRRRGGRPR